MTITFSKSLQVMQVFSSPYMSSYQRNYITEMLVCILLCHDFTTDRISFIANDLLQIITIIRYVSVRMSVSPKSRLELRLKYCFVQNLTITHNILDCQGTSSDRDTIISSLLMQRLLFISFVY